MIVLLSTSDIIVAYDDDYRAVTSVVLIHDEFVLANADDIGVIPKKNFRFVNCYAILGN